METGRVDEQYFIPEEKLYYINPDITHSNEIENKLPKESRQNWQYLKGAKKCYIQVLIVMNMFSMREQFL